MNSKKIMNYLKDNWKEWGLNIFIMFIVFLIGFFAHYLWNNRNQKKIEIEKALFHKKKILQEKEQELREIQIRESFYSLNIGAKSVLVKELNGKKIFAYNEDHLLPIASLTKIFNAIIALENKEKEKKVVMTKRALYAEGEYGLKAYETFSLDDAVNYMVMGSINDIASAISFGETNIIKNWKIFLEKMNNFTKDNAMNSTIFFSENGLDINSHIMGAYSTAEDIAKVVKYFYERFPEFAKKTILLEDNICSDKKCHYVKNTNIILKKYPEIKFSKTGYTKLAGGSLAVVVEIKNKKYIVIILGSGKQERFDDLKKIIPVLKSL